MFVNSKRKIGTTLIEVMITTSCFALVLMVLFQVVKVGSDAWRQAESKGSTQTMMRKIEVYLLDDMRRTGASTVQRLSLADGQTVLWFKSAMGFDSTTDGSKMVFSRTSTGEPLWKRNIIYYATPIDKDWHKERFGFDCPNDTLCPHKLLVRKEVVFPGTTDGTFAQAETISSTDVIGYINKPKSLNMSDELKDPDCLTSAGCKKVLVLADNIQGFDVHFPDGKNVYEYTEGSGALRGIDIAIRVFRYDEASHNEGVNENTLKQAVGEGKMTYTTDNKYEIMGGRYTMQYNLRVVPNN